MIDAAKECKADAVKFQLYDSDKLLPPEMAEKVRHCDLTRKQWCDLYDYANQQDLDCSASVFDLERLKWLKAADPPWYKVASRSYHDVELVKAILAEQKPTYISLGMLPPIDKPLEVTWHDNPNVLFMHCVSQYPAKIEKQFFFSNFHCGFSSHTGEIAAPLYMISRGATVIEVHFSLDKSQPGVDQSSSIEPDDLRTLCRLAPEIERLANL